MPFAFLKVLAHSIIQMLKTEWVQFYKVQEGQSLEEIAAYFSVSPYLLAKRNGLSAPIEAGRILEIPCERGNAYCVREGDTKTLLCGSDENYFLRNGTEAFYIGMKIIL